jgi:hypothetical protein
MANLRNVAALVVSVGLPVAVAFMGTLVSGGADTGTLGFDQQFYVVLNFQIHCGIFTGFRVFYCLPQNHDIFSWVIPRAV